MLSLLFLPTAEATNLSIQTTEVSSKGRLSPPSNNKTFLCRSKLAIKSDLYNSGTRKDIKENSDLPDFFCSFKFSKKIHFICTLIELFDNSYSGRFLHLS